jgi:NAD(P)-dependent dehydrogenase (short-subunit alcohol dehydrogenase family)
MAIRVNAVLPGPVPAEGSQRAPGPLDVARVEKKLPLPVGRLGTPADIAAAVLYLASDASAYVTGHLLVADGGMLLL